MSEQKRKNQRIELADGRYPWDQQPRESDRQHARFVLYRDAGRFRSLTGLNKTLTDIGDTLTYGSLRIQSHLHRWHERVTAWDRHQDELNSANVTKEQQAMTERHRKVATALIGRALAALRAIDDDALTAADIVRFVKLATDIEARVNGMATHTVTVTGQAGGPIQTEDLTTLTPEDRRTRLQEIVAELGRRAGQEDEQWGEQP